MQALLRHQSVVLLSYSHFPITLATYASFPLDRNAIVESYYSARFDLLLKIDKNLWQRILLSQALTCLGQINALDFDLYIYICSKLEPVLIVRFYNDVMI